MCKPIHLLLIAGSCLLLAAGCRREKEDAPAKTSAPSEPAALSKAALDLGDASIAPNGDLNAAIVLSLADGWHTYSDPPGDSGMAPIINLELPDAWRGEILPLPPAHRFEDAAGVTFGYEKELRIGLRLTAPANAPIGQSMPVGATVQYLVCKETCVPQSAELNAVVKVVDTHHGKEEGDTP